MKVESAISHALRQLPNIRRARDWRLYAHNGQRILDLWMDGGRSILGAKGTGLGTAAKACIDMGLLRPLPGIWEHRLEAQLKRSFPGYAYCRFFSSPSEGIACDNIVDPALYRGHHNNADTPKEGSPVTECGTTAAKDTLLIRPFGEFLVQHKTLAESCSNALLRLPCPEVFAPMVMLYKEEPSMPIDQSPPVAPIKLKMAHDSLVALERFGSFYAEEHWKKTDRRLKKLFERQGPYLFPLCTRAEYPELFSQALQKGVLLSPNYDEPSIVPGDFDDGELAPLGRV